MLLPRSTGLLGGYYAYVELYGTGKPPITTEAELVSTCAEAWDYSVANRRRTAFWLAAKLISHD